MRRRERLNAMLLAAACCATMVAATASATVVTLFGAHAPLLDPQGGVRVEKVLFRSMYAQPESTLAAATWPYRVNAGPGEQPGEDINLASVLGIKLDCRGLKTGGQVTIDLTAIRPLPEKLHEQWPKLSRADVVKALVVATDRNLKLVSVFDCRLAVKGAGKAKDLAGMPFPKLLNPRPDVEGDGSE